MKIFPWVILVFFLVPSLSAQEKDTSNLLQIGLDEVVVTATRTKRKLADIPAQIDIISKKEIADYPLNNIDDLLKSSANINVNRSWGIFSKNSSVTMRGLEGSARVLVLIDGVPKNKLGGGSVNWHNINPATIDRIEIIKGPASSLYGNNAMGGVINIITKRPEQKVEGQVESFIGSYNTIGGLMNLGGSQVENQKGFYWNVNGFYRKGDGYIFEPPDFLDETDVPTYLKEFGGGGRIGYIFDKENSIEVTYDYYDELRGAGRRVFLEDGSFEAYQTHQFKTKYTGKLAEGDISGTIYYNREGFFGQKESLNDYKEYRLLDSYSDKIDLGFWTSYSKSFIKNNYLTIGVEGKSGSIDGEEIYRTSPDIIRYRSRMDILGLFVQDEIGIMKDRLKLIAGLRADLVKFYEGYQGVFDPSKVTGFAEGFEEYFTPNNWAAISPKLALQYSLNKRSGVYASYGVGFMPPNLKDLAQTGKIQKGFRIANPELKPEYLTTYELGYNSLLGSKWSLRSAVYYSLGRDFQYMVSTGELIDTGGSSLKPVLKPDNIAQVGILGGEVSLAYYLNKNLVLNAAYSYNHSKVIEYNDNGVHPDQSLAGKFMVEVSPHLFYAGLNYQNRFFQTNLNCNYVDSQWFDDENTILVDDYFLVNLRISKTVLKQFRFYIDVQNILDNEYIDRKGQLSPGRFISAGLKYNIPNR